MKLLSFILDERALKCLNNEKIFFHPLHLNGIDPHRFNQEFTFADDVEVGRHIAFFTGRTIWSMGAYSYSFSEFPPGFHMGAYCSVGRGTELR